MINLRNLSSTPGQPDKDHESPSNDTVPGPSPTSRKSVSDVRKRQNRMAQKAYRDRRKHHIQTLERLVASRDLLWKLGTAEDFSTQQISGGINVVPSVPVAPVSDVRNRIWTEYPYLAGEGLQASKLAPNLDPQFSYAISTGTEQQGLHSLDPGFSSTGNFAWKDFPSNTSINVTDSFSPMYVGGDFIPSSHSVNAPEISSDDSPRTGARTMGFDGSSTNQSGRYNDSSQTYSFAEEQPIVSEDEDFEPRPKSPPLICMSRPSGPRNKIPPATIQRYFHQLPDLVRQTLFQMARTQDYTFIDMISTGIAALISESSNNSGMLAHRAGSADTVIAPPPSFQYGDIATLVASTDQNPYINNLSITRVSYFASIFMNASACGFDFSHYLDENSTSPLYDPELTTATQPDIITVLKTIYSGIAKDLRPVIAQVTKKHHPYLDVLPFPTFRQRAIIAASTDPPLLDEDEMCIDLMINEGLVCWGSPGGVAGMDMGAPWDMRSWEAKPWFLKKWWWLLGDEDDDMRSGSRWWRMMRRVKG